jgi:hypothetical protein
VLIGLLQIFHVAGNSICPSGVPNVTGESLIIAQNGLIKPKDKGTRSTQRVTDFKGSHVLLIKARWEITVSYLNSQTLRYC